MEPITVQRGSGPIILGIPHAGTWLPDDVKARLNERGRLLTDTDWHMPRLYGDLLPGATIVQANFHRYLIDANRDPSGDSLYPGQNTTGLCPVVDFDGKPIWRWGRKPGREEIAQRLRDYHVPYHAALAAEIKRVREEQDIAVLYDCHSIRSVCPFLFEGVLPDFNIGTDNGRTCAPALELAVADICSAADGYTHVSNGRFRGGWTTRHYGMPHKGVHAIQMELAQSTHLASETPPFAYDEASAERLRTHLRAILTRLQETAFSMTSGAL